ncbi:MAG: metal-dependent hydrolase [Roseateles sp.]
MLIDVESLYNLVQGHAQVHAFFHTYVGATLAALALIAAFWLLRRAGLAWLLGLTLHRVTIGALLGAWSHVVLDSVMHADIQPLLPFSADNGLWRIVSLATLHGACVAAGVLGLVVLGVRRLMAARS